MKIILTENYLNILTVLTGKWNIINRRNINVLIIVGFIILDLNVYDIIAIH